MRIYNDTAETLTIRCCERGVEEDEQRPVMVLEIPPDSFFESHTLPPYLRVQGAIARSPFNKPDPEG